MLCSLVIAMGVQMWPQHIEYLTDRDADTANNKWRLRRESCKSLPANVGLLRDECLFSLHFFHCKCVFFHPFDQVSSCSVRSDAIAKRTNSHMINSARNSCSEVTPFAFDSIDQRNDTIVLADAANPGFRARTLQTDEGSATQETGGVQDGLNITLLNQ